MAQALAQDGQLALALDVDSIKHSLGRWAESPSASGLHARRLSLALAGEQLKAGYDAILGQYLARTAFIDDLAALAERLDARFFEVILDVDASTLAGRLASRARDPDRPEHVVNNQRVGPDDAGRLVLSMENLRRARPDAILIDARGSRSSTLGLLRQALTG